MRNAAATLNDDFSYDAPPRTKAPRKPRSTGIAKKKKGKSRRVDWTKIARYGAIIMSVTAAVGIVVNALMMQTGHHPAPLFGQTTLIHQTVPGVTLSQPQAAKPPSAVSQTPPSPDNVIPHAAVNAPRHAAQQEASDKPGTDVIARLLQDGSAPTDKGDTKTILGAQKALAKLGFAVKASGTMGSTTKKAIEAFEKDRHLPVNGELSRRVIKVLSAESGIRID